MSDSTAKELLRELIKESIIESADKPPFYCSGRYSQKVDSKRRIQVPAKWRLPGDNVEFTAVIWPLSPKEECRCIGVITPETLNRLLGEWKHEPVFNDAGAARRRFYSEFTTQVCVDGAGRICLPEWMTLETGIQKDVILIGMMDWGFQIWSPERFAKQKAKDALSIETNPPPNSN